MKIFSVLFFCTALSCGMFAQFPCVDGMANGYPCNNVDLLAFVPNADMGGTSSTSTNDIWGWVSPNTGKEYALVGCSYGTAFVDISEPTQPIYVGVLPTHSVSSLWRDLETYNNYLFVVSEAEQHGLQIFDLLQLDNVTSMPVTFEETMHYDGFSNCHTININPVSGYAYCNGTNTFTGGPHIIDISNPLAPTLAGGFSSSGYTHDSYAWSYDGEDPDYIGKEIVLACNNQHLVIIDVTDKTDCQQIGAYDYEGLAPVGYIHQGWLTKDKKHFLVDDELDEINIGNDQLPYGTRTHMFDITDIDNVNYQGYYESSNLSIDHNLYVKDQFVYESNYRSGVRIKDAVHVADASLTEVGYFDLYPTNDFAQFSGTWSNYPYLPSGVIIATSMYSGFFILKPNLIVLSQDNWTLCGSDQIIFDVAVNAELAFPLSIGVEGLGTATVNANPVTASGNVTITINGLTNVPSGTYEPMLTFQTTFGEQYEIPFHVVIATNLPTSPNLINVPDNGVVSNTAVSTQFEWEALNNADSYVFQIASDAGFTSIIETQTTSSASFLLTYDLPDGIYFWRVRAINGCGEGVWSEVYSFSIQFVGVNEISHRETSIFPNPATDQLNIVSQSQLTEITISDLRGRILQKVTPLNTKNSTLDISYLPAGVYMISVNGFVSKLLKD